MLAAVSVGNYFGVDENDINDAVSSYQSDMNRSQIIEKGNNTIYLDAYNANPTSMNAALESFAQLNSTKEKALILGDMFELGEDTEHEHQNIVNLCNRLGFNRCVFVGEHYSKTSAVEKYLTVASLKEDMTATPLEKSYILIKGSRGMFLEQLLEYIN